MDELHRIKKEILEICIPEKMILYGQKKFVSNDKVKSIDICLVVETDDKMGIEKKIYLTIDSEISFDVIIYTPGEWAVMMKDPQSFASRILEKGTVIWNASDDEK